MHHALEIEEILANIFYHCSLPILAFYDDTKPDPVLAALARTCRAFKEPALDALWISLPDMAPLAQCLPDASYQVPQRVEYSFSRPLSNFEWDILRGYARRIRCIRYFRDELDGEALKFLSNHPTAESFFPNLRYLNCELAQTTMFFWRFPLPSLISLEMSFEDPTSFQPFINSFAVSAPNIRTLSVGVQYDKDEVTAESGFLCRWQDLRSVTVWGILLDKDSIEHLSHMPALTMLSIELSVTRMPPAFDPSLSFSNLETLNLTSTHLHLVTQFLSHAQLPAITKLKTAIENCECPAMQEIASLWDSLLGCNAGHTIESLTLEQCYTNASAKHLSLEDLRPCMGFKHLLSFSLTLGCKIFLSDSDLLTLASAWPNLERIGINCDHGWNSEYGITPGGLVRLFEACPRLSSVTLRLDTRGYIEVPPSESPAVLGWTFPSDIYINVLDSVIEDESIPAIATFFSGLATGCGSSSFLHYWNFLDYPDPFNQRPRWRDVLDRIDEAMLGAHASPCEESDSDLSGEY